MLLVACAIFVPRLKGDTAGHINSSHRGVTLRDECPYWVSAFIEWKTLQDGQTFHRQWPELWWNFTSSPASSSNLTGYTFRMEIFFVEGVLAFLGSLIRC